MIRTERGRVSSESHQFPETCELSPFARAKSGRYRYESEYTITPYAITPPKLATSCQLGVYCRKSSKGNVGRASVCTVRTNRFSSTPAQAIAAAVRSHGLLAAVLRKVKMNAGTSPNSTISENRIGVPNPLWW